MRALQPVYGTGPVKRARRTKAELQAFRDAIFSALEADHPQSVRHVFYELTVTGVIPKEERHYKATSRLMTEMRRAGTLPYAWVTDSTRMMRKPRSHRSLVDALHWTAETYRRALWAGQPVYVEIWCESRSAAGVLYEETSRWDVPLMPASGFSSETFLESSGAQIREIGKPTWIYYFGDHDPSGLSIGRVVEDSLRSFAPDVEIHFEWVAVTPEQIVTWNLPSKPPKPSDSRTKKFYGHTVELEAIPAKTLRALARQCIERHIDQRQLEQLLVDEAAEREVLQHVARQVAGWGPLP